VSADQNGKGTVLAAAAAWNAGDVDGYLSMFDPSLMHHGLGPEPLDAEANRGFYERLSRGFPGCQLVIDDILAEEDRVAVRLRLLGEHTGDFMGVAATGRGITVNGQTILTFREGRVVERWTTVDFAALMSQLG
jgi:predicted ester cyclase